VLIVGVDEAGYGPLLGPLVVGATAFRVRDADPDPDGGLRRRLQRIVCTSDEGVRGDPPPALPVPIDDSKRIRQRFGTPGLSRGVGLFSAALDQAPPSDLEDLLLRHSDRASPDYSRAPWFEDLGDVPLPRYPWTGRMHTRFVEEGVEALDLRVLPVDAPEWNDGLERLGNKADLLGLHAAALLLSILDRHPGEEARIVVDRHGGRRDYAGYLQAVFPFAPIRALAGGLGESRYEVRGPDRRLEFRFLTRGDERSLPVGWASMAAKLTRELFMARLNAWFQRRLPGVRPTAGYVQDGRRFLGEVGSLLETEQVPQEVLVRSR